MKVGFIGFGNMAQAIASGMIRAGISTPQDLIASRRDEKKAREIEEHQHIHMTTDNLLVATQADVLILAVKPQMLNDVISEIKDSVDENKLIISIAAGKSTEWLCNAFSKTVKLVRCMPNTPALVSEGCTGICFNELVSSEEKDYVLKLFGSLGLAREVTENMMDVVVGVSGSSPAYVFMFMEAMADAAVLAGMPRKLAYEFCAQAVLGSAKLMLETGKHPGELKDMVCSPAGTTIEAVRVLEEKGLRGTVMDGVLRCIERSREL